MSHKWYVAFDEFSNLVIDQAEKDKCTQVVRLRGDIKVSRILHFHSLLNGLTLVLAECTLDV